MPELPEVEVVRRGLQSHVVGRRVVAVEVLHARPLRRDPSGPEGFAAAVTGRTVTQALRRGKYFWLALDGTDAVLGHLGMSGQMLVKAPGSPAERHLRVRFDLDDGSELRFVDQRMFGGLSFSPGGAVLPDEIAHIALDPLDPDFDVEAVARRIRSRGSALKRQLLDQTVVSGVGNIYADEALWRAGIHGERLASSLTGPAIGRLLDHAKDVMSDALEQGGTSFDALYVNVNGASGYFDRSLSAYGQEGRPCPRCGTTMRREQFMNRSSTSCPRCQVRPRRIPG